MRPSFKAINTIALFFLTIVLLLNFSFINSPGTKDARIYLRWAERVMDYGPIAGYCSQPSDYPPVTFAVLWLFGSLFGSNLMAIKSSIFLFWLFHIAIVLLLSHMTKNPFWLGVALATNPAIWVNAQFLGYLDVYFAPFLLMALFLLQSGLLIFWSGVLFGLSILLKWQPLIILPFFLMMLWRSDTVGRSRWRSFSVWIGGMGLVMGAALSVFALGGYGDCVVSALHKASSLDFVSGNALNADWIITYFLHLIRPDLYGPLVDGASNFIKADLSWVRIFNAVAVLLAYSFFMWLLLRRGRSLSDFCIASLGGGLSYFVFGYSVHENHGFILIILATLLLLLSNTSKVYSLYILAIVSLLHLINLMLFYGLTGEPLVNRVVLGLDTSLIFAVAHIVFFGLLARDAARYMGQLAAGSAEIKTMV